LIHFYKRMITMPSAPKTMDFHVPHGLRGQEENH